MSVPTRNLPGRFVGAAALVAAYVSVISAPAMAVEDVPQHETVQERQACMPDVLRLCRSLVPDRKAITDCLVANAERLSPACHQVMAHHR